MTYREAIETILDYKPIFGWREYCKAIEIAVSALKDCEEREEPCIMCSEFGNNRRWLVSQGNGMYVEYTYQYCPMCGRKLGDEE